MGFLIYIVFYRNTRLLKVGQFHAQPLVFVGVLYDVSNTGPADRESTFTITGFKETMKIPACSEIARFYCLVVFLISAPQLTYGQAPPGKELVLVSPFPGTMAVTKTPKISFRSPQPLLEEGQLILLDGNDITALVTSENGVYSFTPLSTLPAGDHYLYIAAYTEDGTPIEKEFSFTSRQSESFEEVYSNNRVSATLKSVLSRDFSPDEGGADSDDKFPYASFDSYLSTDSALKEGKWDTSLRANVRYYDQNAALMEPEKKGLSLLDFLITANYAGENYTALAEVGDTTIEESRNTIDYLTRRGGKASISAGNLTLNGFGVLGAETGYEIEGLGFGFNSSDHIMGASAQIDFFDQRMSLKGIYAQGGEEGNSFGTWSEAEGRTGDVAGIVLTTDFFNQLVTTDFEFDTVNYDRDTGDDEDKFYDKAYRIRIGGLTEVYDYDVSYNYTGPQYDVVGNQSIIKDWAGFDFSGGMTQPFHALRLLMNYSWDNVEDDDLFARIYSFTGGLDYQYYGWDRFPVSLLFEHNRQRSADEPIDTESISLDTSTLTGSIGYIEGAWAVEFRSSYSEQNDKTSNNYDNQLFTFGVVPSYTHTFFSILPSWTFNSSKDLVSDVRTDTNTLTLDVYSSLFRDSVTCELGGTYDWSKADDNNLDMNNTALYGRLNYHFEQLWRLEDSTIALEYHYNRQEDKIYESVTRENTITLVLSSAIPYSF